MSLNLTYKISVTGGGFNYQSPDIDISGSSGFPVNDDEMETAEAGSLTTRSTDTTGTITMTSGAHTIATADVVDIYWTEGGVLGVRYGVTVGTVVTTAVPISGGDGDVLPTQDVAVTVVRQYSINVAIDGDNANAVLVVCQTPSNLALRDAAHVELRDSGGSTIKALFLTTNVPYLLDLQSFPNESNPLTGNPITNAKVSHGGTTATTRAILISGSQDASP